MTRKRYIKLLMALPAPRNEAAQCADYARAKGYSYAAAGREFAGYILRLLQEMNAANLPQMQEFTAKVRKIGGGAEQ